MYSLNNHTQRPSAALKSEVLQRQGEKTKVVKLIMIAELGDKHRIILNFIYNAMFIGDSARPISGETMF